MEVGTSNLIQSRHLKFLKPARGDSNVYSMGLRHQQTRWISLLILILIFPQLSRPTRVAVAINDGREIKCVLYSALKGEIVTSHFLHTLMWQP